MSSQSFSSAFASATPDLQGLVAHRGELSVCGLVGGIDMVVHVECQVAMLLCGRCRDPFESPLHGLAHGAGIGRALLGVRHEAAQAFQDLRHEGAGHPAALPVAIERGGELLQHLGEAALCPGLQVVVVVYDDVAV